MMNKLNDQPVLAAYLLSEAASRLAFGIGGVDGDSVPGRPSTWFTYPVATWDGHVLERLHRLGSVGPEAESALVACARERGVTPVLVYVPGESLKPWSHLADVETEYLVKGPEGTWADKGWLMRRMATPDACAVTRWEELRQGFESEPLQTAPGQTEDFWDGYAAGFSAWVKANSTSNDAAHQRWSWSKAWSRFRKPLLLTAANATLDHPQADTVRLRPKGYPFLQFNDRDRKFLGRAGRTSDVTFDRDAWGDWVRAAGDLWGSAQGVWDDLLRRVLAPARAMAAPDESESRMDICAGSAVPGIALGTPLGWVRHSGKKLELMLELPSDTTFGSVRAELRILKESKVVRTLQSSRVSLNDFPSFAGVRSFRLELIGSGEPMTDVQLDLLLVFDDGVELKVSYAQ